MWVRGRENVRKRVLIRAAGCKLGLLLCGLTGVGAPRSLQGRALSAIYGLSGRRIDRWGRLAGAMGSKWTPTAFRRLNRSSPSCLKRSAQRTDLFHGLLWEILLRRSIAALTSRTFDLVVIGGGIYGAICAWDATLRGLKVGIIDRADFGSGTSSNSAKILHGGVRTLQSGNLRTLRLFVRERRALCRIVPHLVRPLAFVIPTYRGISHNRTLLRLYFALNDLLAHGRNDGIAPSRQLPPSRLLSRNECLHLNPLIAPEGVTGGLEWFDYQMYSSDRVHFSFIASAAESGAVVANYVEAKAGLTRGKRLEGIRARDMLTGESLEIRARVVLNAAGPWALELSSRLAPSGSARLSGRLAKAMNLVIASPLRGSHAVAGRANGRFLFVAPWREVAIVGTSYDRYDGSASQLALERREIEAFVGKINTAFPELSLNTKGVRLIHRGLLPALGRGDGVRRRTNSEIVDHRRHGVHGLISVVGSRYTTARDAAERAVDLAIQQMHCTVARCRTGEVPLVGGDMEDADAFVDEVGRRGGPIAVATRTRLARTYGTRYQRVVGRLVSTARDRTPLGATCAVTAGEIRHAVREEMAVRLSDALLRRTEAGSAGYPGDDAVVSAARIMAGELEWGWERLDREVADVRQAYLLPR